ncbi:MAG: UDP-N-acetylmuramate--L-alanine ligase [Anaerolineae bacterium]|nr:MAG: UDP-N-acetylmuramate--L-alanine ligase [Anaerolineae bacterium]
MHYHLIGIGGTGLSAIARVLLEQGHTVSGSDRQRSPLAEAVAQAGGRVYIGHAAEHIAGAQVVIRSSAIPDENPEVQAARSRGIPVLKRSDFLGDLMSGQDCLAVAGTHGKTTTTAMLAWALTAQGQDPSYIIGGVSANLGNNAHAGAGRYFVIEADEYDRMFLGLSPRAAIVTNMEHDHPDCYPTPQDFAQAFQAFTDRLRPDGFLLVCSEDAGAASLGEFARTQGRRVLTYGFSPQAVYRAQNLRLPPEGGGYTFRVMYQQESLGDVSLHVPGRHNVLNALAVVAMLHQLGLPLERVAEALNAFSGTGRRFEILGEADGVTVIDDYAHHPTEIEATLEAARARFPGRRLWAVWQPHTYSRTRTLQERFAAAFSNADKVLVTPVYAAREAPPADGFDASHVVRRMQHPSARYCPSLEATTKHLLARLQSGDVVLVFSAGDATQISRSVLESLRS